MSLAPSGWPQHGDGSAPLRGKAEARREQGAGGRKGRERIDTTKAKPVTNSLADAMPAELKAQASAE